MPRAPLAALAALAVFASSACVDCAGTTGNPCTPTAGCLRETCDTRFDGGYCTQPCTHPGTLDICSAVERVDGVCMLPAGDGGFECASDCTPDSGSRTCRAGFRCVPVPGIPFGACVP